MARIRLIPALRLLPGVLVLAAMFLGGIRAACPMHATASPGHHHGHGTPAPSPVPCSCIGDCVLPIAPALDRPVTCPTARLVHAEVPAARAPLPVRDARPPQLRLPFATAPPAA